jgi:hypothetical protein
MNRRLRSQMENGWFRNPGDKAEGASELALLSDLDRVLAEHIINKLEYVPQMTYQVVSGRGSFLTIEIVQVIEISVSPDPLKFHVGSTGPISLDGLISYLNEIWIPSQKRSLERASKRSDMTADLHRDLGKLAVVYDDLTNLPGLVKCIARFYKAKSGKVKYFVITNDQGKEALTKHPNASRWDIARAGLNDVNLVVVTVRSDLNMVKVSWLTPNSAGGQYYNRYNSGQSGWFAPKNILYFLGEQLKGQPKLAALLADPDNVVTAPAQP